MCIRDSARTVIFEINEHYPKLQGVDGSHRVHPVSYTHLDVYKRQRVQIVGWKVKICVANQAQAVVTIYIFSGILEIGLKTKCRRQDLLFSSNLAFYFSTASTHKMPHTAEQTLARCV